jgi:hypothetical protein
LDFESLGKSVGLNLRDKFASKEGILGLAAALIFSFGVMGPLAIVWLPVCLFISALVEALASTYLK